MVLQDMIGKLTEIGNSCRMEMNVGEKNSWEFQDSHFQ
jgi:hypothetical protein